MSRNSNDPFTQKKRFILEQIGSPDGTDLSPKGSIDEPLLDLIGLINTHPDMVTTSSCSGRLSVFLEGSKHHLGGGVAMGSSSNDGQQQQVQKVGGKGLGGKWLYISHEPETINSKEWWQTVKETNEHDEDQEISKEDLENRYVLYKFEAMVSSVLLCVFFLLSAILE
jgi:tRNA wybutosine-synthesizing protein 3